MEGQTLKWPSWLRIVALSTTILAVDFAYAVEGGYGTPTLLKTGLEERYASLMWSVSPVLGILFQSYLGSASDKCTCSWGRRRPFILMIGIIVLLALAFFPYGPSLASVLSLTTVKPFVIAYTTVLFISMDFSLDAIQSPCRSFLLDSLSKECTPRGNLIYSTMMGIGATLGAAVAAIPWKKLGGELGNNFETQTKMVFGFTVGLFLLCIVLTTLSVNENHTSILRGIQSPRLNEEMKVTTCKCSSCFKDSFISFKDSFSFAKDMSATFLSLWVLTFLGYFTLNSYFLFYTEYVGSVIYGGVADSDDKELRDLYDEGVLFGCACLFVCNVTLFISSMLQEKILSCLKISLSHLTLYTFLSSLAIVGFAMVYPNKLTAVLVSVVAGLLYSVMTTVPFTLVAQYETNGVLLRSKQSESTMGTAVSFLYIAVFGSQILLGLLIGNLIQVFNTSRVIIIMVFSGQFLATVFLICNLKHFANHE